ncbi:MAG TPA: DEAD/DEAH box helicase [Tenuifilaceae bacterium]|nr:DEAD/DEAH box helicase [Tenuifilaceae bacterium]HPI43603.1 DEAD/DEAH box helicase [Tenuifilaceae bacterium]HPN22859.1 DEAD/DEAH box helicase [Tenuifilaceae bacterium]HPV56386.1 DEAD/DEAH box helicase [Tenuifilaceae bacterium]
MRNRTPLNNRGQRNFDSKRTSRFKSSGNGQSKSSSIDPKHFVKKAVAQEVIKHTPTQLIEELPVNTKIVSNLLKKGFKTPTEIQEKTLDAILEGRNLLGLAQTGTGKTAAFLVPIIHNLINQKPNFQVLIVSPTRELALQIDEEFKSIGNGLNLSCTSLIGGTSVGRDINNLRRPSHIIIGTPGRISDMVRQRALNLKNFSVLVLDEFDRLLDMGFSRDIQFFVDGMSNRKQTVLFSATEEKGQKNLINNLLENPVEIRVRTGNVSADSIEQDVVVVKNGENKMNVLINMVRDESFEKVLVFAETKRWVSRICRDLRVAGIKADEIHGNKSQNYRINALNSFKNKKIQVLVATDVAARGLDISNVSHVINYQQPKNIDSYIHRIGRTGRAGESGKAFTFIN